MKGFSLGEATLDGVKHERKGGALGVQIRVAAVLSTAEQKKLHIGLNGFKAVTLDQEFETVELKFFPPDALKSHQLALSIDRAVNFKVREQEAKDGKPDRQVLEFTAYATGPQFEAVQFMNTLGSQTCRMELIERQGELFEQPAAGKAAPAKRSLSAKRFAKTLKEAADDLRTA